MRKIFSGLAIIACVACGCAVSVGCKNEKERTRYEIVAEYRPEDGALAGTVKVDFFNSTEVALDCLKFNLYANAYRENALYSPVSLLAHDEAYYAGESYGEMSVTSVLGVKLWEVGGEDENVLYAHLEQPIYPDERVVLDIGFSTKLAKVNHRAGITPRTVNLGGCIPLLCGLRENTFVECTYETVGDPFFNDCADFTAHITVPKDYVVASVGEEVEEKTLESKKRHTMYATNVRDFALVLSDQLRVLRGEVGKIQLNYYYLQDETAKETFAFLKEVLGYYSSAFGEYPYSTFSAVQTGLVFDGMEYPTLSMLSASLTGKDLLRALAHEAAHQWWYAAVGSDQLTNAWQDEGLAEYSSLLFFEKHGEYGVDAAQLLRSAREEYKNYRTSYERTLGWVDSRMTRPLGEYLNEYEYKCIAFDKSVVMWDALRGAIGEKRLLGGLRKYYTENKHKRVLPSHLVGAFERTGLNLHGFFEGYLEGKGTL